MSGIVALGESRELDGYALVGARVIRSHSDAGMIAAFDALDDDVGLVILTTWSADVLAEALRGRPRLLHVVLP